jgi:LPXTG-motif cell wall-anchored protein
MEQKTILGIALALFILGAGAWLYLRKKRK